MNTNEIIGDALVHYLEAKPTHNFGVCSWLFEILVQHHDVPDYMAGNGSYRLVESLTKWSPAVKGFFSGGSYVDTKFGPTPTRLKFVEQLLRELEKDYFVFDEERRLWVLTGEQQ